MEELFDLVVGRPEIRDALFKKVMPDDWDVVCSVQFRITPMKPVERATDEIFRHQLENRLNARGHEIEKKLAERIRALWEAR